MSGMSRNRLEKQAEWMTSVGRFLDEHFSTRATAFLHPPRGRLRSETQSSLRRSTTGVLRSSGPKNEGGRPLRSSGSKNKDGEVLRIFGAEDRRWVLRSSGSEDRRWGGSAFFKAGISKTPSPRRNPHLRRTHIFEEPHLRRTSPFFEESHHRFSEPKIEDSLFEEPLSSKNPSHLRRPPPSSEPKVEELPPIFDLRSRRTKNPSIFDVRSSASNMEEPLPSSLFGPEEWFEDRTKIGGYDLFENRVLRRSGGLFDLPT